MLFVCIMLIYFSPLTFANAFCFHPLSGLLTNKHSNNTSNSNNNNNNKSNSNNK